MTHHVPRSLILGSTSAYRRTLLNRLQIPFSVKSPHVDETALPGETPAYLAQRLALFKAQAVAERFPSSVVIGADQVAELDGIAIGKPETHERARTQLRLMSGKRLVFHTAVAVVCQETGFCQQALVPVAVAFRTLSDQEIEHYLLKETPYDCAGSAKSEGLGIALLESIHSDDPTALIGLPLIHTCRMLRAAGVELLGT